jgi:hypothetical protein
MNLQFSKILCTFQGRDYGVFGGPSRFTYITYAVEVIGGAHVPDWVILTCALRVAALILPKEDKKLGSSSGGTVEHSGREEQIGFG